MGGLESRMSSAQTARRLARCVTLYLGFKRKSSCGAVLSGRCAACLMATGHAERLMHVQGKQIKSNEIIALMLLQSEIRRRRRRTHFRRREPM